MSTCCGGGVGPIRNASMPVPTMRVKIVSTNPRAVEASKPARQVRYAGDRSDVRRMRK